jgi:hypothetical protein
MRVKVWLTVSISGPTGGQDPRPLHSLPVPDTHHTSSSQIHIVFVVRSSVAVLKEVTNEFKIYTSTNLQKTVYLRQIRREPVRHLGINDVYMFPKPVNQNGTRKIAVMMRD